MSRRSSAGFRAGVALIAIIGVFAVTAVLLTAWTRSVVAADRQARRDRAAVQARWLADAGVHREVARIRNAVAQSKSDAWDVESWDVQDWEITADELRLSHGAIVRLAVTGASAGLDSEESEAIAVTAVASYPANNPHVRHTKSITFTP